MLMVFWVEALNKLFDGGMEVPIVDPASSATFKCLGVILTHGYILTGFYPVNIAEAVSTKLLVTSGSQPCCDNVLLSSMLKYVSPLEKVADGSCSEWSRGNRT